jgi:fluoride exporter
MTASEFLAVFIGGGVGAVARFGLARCLSSPDAFPWVTLVINVIGSAILGIVVVIAKDRPTLGLLLGTGFCGGFTTFSTFSVEVVRLLDADRVLEAIAYISASVVAGVLAAYLTMRVV